MDTKQVRKGVHYRYRPTHSDRISGGIACELGDVVRLGPMPGMKSHGPYMAFGLVYVYFVGGNYGGEFAGLVHRNSLVSELDWVDAHEKKGVRS